MKYCLSISLPAGLTADVSTIQERFQGPGGRSEPHLTIIPPRELIGRGSQLIDSLRRVCRDLIGLPIRTTGLGQFNNFRTIVVNVDKSAQLLACYELLNQAVEHILASPEPDFAFVNPHITLADHLDPKAGVEAWNELKARQFCWQFNLEKINLLRRRDTQAAWQLSDVFHLARNSI